MLSDIFISGMKNKLYLCIVQQDTTKFLLDIKHSKCACMTHRFGTWKARVTSSGRKRIKESNTSTV